MGRRSQKGAFRDPAVAPALGPAAVSGAVVLTTVAGYGYGPTDGSKLDLSHYASTPLIANNVVAVRNLMKNKAPSTVKGVRRHLSEIRSYIEWYRKRFAAAPSLAEEVTPRFSHQFIVYQFERESAESSKSHSTRWFKRFLAEIGVPLSLLPPNPFRDESSNDARDSLSAVQAKQILNRAKFEIEVVRRRTREAHQLASKGQDPRRHAGGRAGDWAKPENRAWVMKRLLKRELHTFDDLRFKLGHRTVLAGIEGRAGAEVINSEGSVERLSSWNGHLRWFFPWPSDLAPFAALVMLRTGWNLSTVTALQSRHWLERYPYRLSSGSEESHAFIVSHKARGREHELEPSKEERFPSSRRPHSHPYRLLKFVEYLTAGLRKEIWRRRSALLALEERTIREDEELDRLDRIKDDLFIFKTEQGISSFQWLLTREGTVGEVADFLRRAGVPQQTRPLRDAAILFSYEASGQNLFVAQLLANHANQNTTALYLRRRRTLGVERSYRDRRGKLHRQLEATRAERSRASGRLLLPWLESLNGLGPVRARRVFEAFGHDLTGILSDAANLDAIVEVVEPNGRARLARTMARTLGELRQRREAEEAGRTPPHHLADMRPNTLLILDEASMIDTATLHEIISAMPNGARLLMVGDHGQLPPVGFGQVFHDLVADGKHVANLTTVLRQANDNPIPSTAALIRQGITPPIPSFDGSGSGIFIQECDQSEIIKQVIAVRGALDRGAKDDEVLVCAALKRTVSAINDYQSTTDPGAERVRINSSTWVSLGDPVICLRNHYRDALYNGLLGTVCEISSDLVVRWDGEDEPRAVPSDILTDLDLAHAVTCHKAQGSSTRRVIVPLEGTRLLTREWLYTAVTRATEQVVLIGPRAALAAAVQRRSARLTGFRASDVTTAEATASRLGAAPPSLESA